MTLEEKLAQIVGFWEKGDGEVVAPLQGEFTRRARPRRGRAARARAPDPRRTAPVRSTPVERARVAVGAAALGWSARPGSASRRSCTRSASPGSRRGRAATFPTPLAWGASFDPDARRADGRRDRRRRCARSASTRGWRRCSTSSATPAGAGSTSASRRTRTSSARIGTSYVRGLQSAGVHATLKHFVGYSALPGRPQLRAGARRPARGRRRPAGAVRDGGPRRRRALGHALVRRDRRRPGGRRPATCSPVCCATAGASTARSSPTTSASRSCTSCTTSRATSARPPALALAAGVDIELPTGDAYLEPLAEAVARGPGRRGAGRPRGPAGAAAEGGARAARRDVRRRAADRRSTSTAREHRGLAARLAEESVVLLSNDGTLPARAARRRVAVIGPNADRVEALFGCYSFVNHVLAQHPGAEIGHRRPDGARGARGRVARRRARRRRAGARSTTTTGTGFAEAVARGRALADVAVLVVGDHAGLFGRGTVGEGCDRDDLELPGRAARARRGGARHRARRSCSSCSPAGPTPSAGRWSAAPPWCRRSSRARRAAPRVAGVLSGRVNPSGQPAGEPAALGRCAALHLPAPRARRGRRRDQPAQHARRCRSGTGCRTRRSCTSDLEVDAQVPTERAHRRERPGHQHGRPARGRRRAALRARRRRLGDPPGGAARRVPACPPRARRVRRRDLLGPDDPAGLLRPRPACAWSSRATSSSGWARRAPSARPRRA